MTAVVRPQVPMRATPAMRPGSAPFVFAGLSPTALPGVEAGDGPIVQVGVAAEQWFRGMHQGSSVHTGQHCAATPVIELAQPSSPDFLDHDPPAFELAIQQEVQPVRIVGRPDARTVRTSRPAVIAGRSIVFRCAPAPAVPRR
jgi:hypothetical protein